MIPARRARIAAALAAALALVAALPAAAAPLRLPATTRATLGNGLTVVVMPTRRLPLVDLRLVARAGSVHDPKGQEGLAGLTADLMTQGAGGRDARRLAEDIESVGGVLEAHATTEQLVVTCEVLSRDLGVGLGLFRDVVVHPTFPADEFTRRRDEALGAIAADRDDPAAVADKAVLPFVLGDGPLGHPVIGWEAAVAALTRDDVAAFHRANVTPDRSILAVVGDVEPKAVLAALERAFKEWRPSGAKRAAPYAPLTAIPRAVRVVEKPEVTQTQIRMLGLGVAYGHPDHFPIVVANTILGTGFTSRLVDEIRTTRGLTYSISSRFTMLSETGTFGISTFTRNDSLRRMVDEVLRSVTRLVDEGPSEEELARARSYLTGQFPLDLQAPDALAEQLADIGFLGLDPRWLETWSERVEAVTMADCRRALKAYLRPEDLRILVVSDPAVAKPALAGLGPIDVVPVP